MPQLPQPSVDSKLQHKLVRNMKFIQYNPLSQREAAYKNPSNFIQKRSFRFRESCQSYKRMKKSNKDENFGGLS